MSMLKNKARFARLLLGVIYFVFGLNGFFNFIPVPSMPAPAAAFLGAMWQTGYLFPLLKITEIVAGACLLANVYVSLMLIVLVPITVNILLFHLCLAWGGLPAAVLIAFLHGYLLQHRNRRFDSLLKKDA